MRATFAFATASAFVSFVACGSADVGSIFKKDCNTDAECGAGNYCKVGVCLATASGGASGTGGTVSSSGGAVESGGQTSESGGAIATGGASTGGAPATGGTLGTGGSVVESGGSPATGGAQATGGTGGTGGSSDGGRAATGGAASTGGASTTGGAASTGGASSTGVYCGNRSCPGDQICCASADWSQDPPAGTFTCTTGTCSNGEGQIECSANADCHQGQKCCLGSGGRRLYACMDNCPAAEIACTGPNVCDAGEMCCETTTSSSMGGGETPTAAKCASSCKGDNGSGQYILCHSNEDCPTKLPRCAASNLLAGFKRCWPSGVGPGPGGP